MSNDDSPSGHVKRVSIFVDVQNVYYTTRERYSRNLDYNKLWSLCTNGRKVISAYAYAIDRGDRKQIEFQNILKAIGFEVKLKPYIQRSDGSAKGDWDVGITIDIMEQARSSDVVVLVSGDGDFAILVDHIINKYKLEVEVYSVPELTANKLMESATRHYPIDNGLLL